MEKQCSKCNEIKDITEFELRKDTNTYRNDCKVCIKAGKKVSRLNRINNLNNNNNSEKGKVFKKKCFRCEIVKDIDGFQFREENNKYRNECKECQKKYKKGWDVKNISHKKNEFKKWWNENKEGKNLERRKYKEPEIKKKCLYCKKEFTTPRKTPYAKYCSRNCKTKWLYHNNEDYRKKDKERFMKRYNNDELFYLKVRCRSRIYEIFRNNKIQKNKSTEELIGCTYEELKIHIEKQFKNGMNWKNKGKWHIDHIKPLSLAKTEEEIIKLCHYTNLQPLWEEDNIKKSNKFEVEKYL